jgi:hypothetical protein
MGHAKLVLIFGDSGGWRSLSDHVFFCNEKDEYFLTIFTTE